jgi:starch-binding outer membrane protein, SusD/RagB family
MKTFKKITMILLAMLVLGSCSDDFLTVKPKGTSLVSNFYTNRSEAYSALTSVYDVVGWMGNNLITKVGALNSASDDHYAGGGGETDMFAFQVMSDYSLLSAVNGPGSELWKKGYSGAFRANILLQKLPGVPMDEDEKARFAAEAKLLRAYFYFDLVRLFKNIPLILEPLSADQFYNVTQVSPEEVYAQIEKDLVEAIPDLPNKITTNEKARVTAGTAHALLGKVYLYQNKFTAAAEELEKVNGTTPGEMNATFGYKLVDNFGDLWKTSNEFNSESIFEISFTNTSVGDWGCAGCSEGNIINVMSGPRGFQIKDANAGIAPYVSGWSFFVITPDLADLMKDDPRYPYTIADIGKWEDEGKVQYQKGYMDTGYFLEKFAAKQWDRWSGAGNPDLNYPQNMYEIRLADTYLMEAEALVRGGGDTNRAQALLDAVRNRVGLDPTPATLDAIYRERRFELVGEGHRWFDLIRTGQAAQALEFKNFVPGKHEVLPIPELELANTKLVQSEEWR